MRSIIIWVIHCLSGMHTNTVIAPPTEPARRMAQLHKGERATITGMAGGDAASEEARLRLMELGFVPGEQVRVVAESFPGGDPMAVRVGNSTFALRRHEAMWVEVSGVQP